jgi:hypothetical protein
MLLTRSPSSPPIRREPVGKTTQTDSCSQHTRADRRGGHRNVGLKAHRAKTGLPSLRSPESFGEREFSAAKFPGYVGELKDAGFVSGELD